MARIVDANVKHEAIDLGFGERIRTLLLDWVLSRHDHERLVELVAGIPDGDLELLHRLQQCALHLGRRPVDLVG